ncbi:hypothetical protein NMG60_11003033 [Bertholletia excelsa]
MKKDGETVSSEQQLRPRRAKSREVNSRFLSPSSAAQPETRAPSPVSPLRQKLRSSTDGRKQRSLEEAGGFHRGGRLWPSSTPTNPSGTLADHLVNERLKDLVDRKKKNENPDDAILLNRQRSCTELRRFKKTDGNISNLKENHKPFFGGSMRYTGKLLFRGQSSTSSSNTQPDALSYLSPASIDGIVPGRFSVDELSLRRRSFGRKSEPLLDNPESESDCSDVYSGTSFGSPITGRKSSSSHPPKLGMDVSPKYKFDASMKHRRGSSNSEAANPASFSDNSPKKYPMKSEIKRANSLTLYGRATSKWALSPGRTGRPPASVEIKGKPTTFSSLRPPSSPTKAKGVGNLLSMGLDLFRSKKSSATSPSPPGIGATESVHQLRLVHNRLIQWRYANARADAVNGRIAKQAELKPLEAWGDMERQYSSALSMTKDCLYSVICSVPLVEGAKMEPYSTSTALRHASDLAASIKSMMSTFSPWAKKIAPILYKLAGVVTEERALLEEFLELFYIISNLEDLQRQVNMDDLEAGGHNDTVDLDRFFDDVEKVKEDMKDVEKLHRKLQELNEESKTVHNAKTMKDLRSKMDADVSAVLKKVKIIKGKLEALDRANAAHRSIPGCGPGSSADRTRTSVVSGLGKKLKTMMDDFQALRAKMAAEYKETVERRYFTITGEKANEELIENLISSGQSETFLQKAIQDQGRGQIMDTISEIQERHDAVKEIEKNLMELHQVFLDMAALVEAQGQQLNDIENHVSHASSFVRRGTEQLEEAREHQKSSRKWTCLAILLIIAILIIVLFPILSSVLLRP